MKSLKLFYTSILILTISPIFSQVKIGDNATTINANSLLEMESTNKGFLCPRVAINDVNSILPLSGTVPEGMLVYNATGTVTKGYYNWNGTKWVRLETSVNTRNNYVLVKTASDLPAAVAGIRTLTANTLYEINGTIVLTDKIDLNGCTVMGMDHMNDKLVYTPATGELFTGANSGTLKMLTVSAPTAGAKLFNLDAGGAAKDIIVNNLVIAQCNNVGTIKNSTGYVLFSDVLSVYNTNGITFQDLTKVHLNNFYWQNTNYNTYEKFIGTFETIRISGGSIHALASQSATALDISGLTSLQNGDLKQVLIIGDGTYLNGSFSSAWEVETHGLSSEKDGNAAGNLYMTIPVANPITTVNVAEKILGTTTSVNLFRISAIGNNRLAYTGTKTRYFSAIGSLSVSSAAANKNFSFYIAKNGVILPESMQTLRLSTTADKGSLTLSCNVQMATNDYIEVFVKNETDNTSITVISMNVALK